MTTSVESRLFERFRAAIDDVLDSPFPNRSAQAESFLRGLAVARVRLSEFDKLDLPASGGAYGRGERMPSVAELRLQLTSEERAELQQYLAQKVEKLKKDFPHLVEKFKEQFA